MLEIQRLLALEPEDENEEFYPKEYLYLERV